MNKMNIVIFQIRMSQGVAYGDQKPAILPCRRKGIEYDKSCGHASCHTAYAFKNIKSLEDELEKSYSHATALAYP